ncbi:MAG: bifunctional diguanylate cyclase/phosphodiesterase, partial [Clostridiaceae bacterium]|nr:bifunctional diguanylate cyclase/phosphodiesterase [Clostridiaceae bacterium]
NKAVGMLVIEDSRKADLRVRHNQLYFLGMIVNILGDTRKKIIYEERLYNYAYFDESTKLANRNMLKKNIEQLLHGRKESEKLVIFDIELDNLRIINDSFGHNIGEQVVIKSASILEHLMKDGCTLSRVAEGKFVIVMPIAETTEQIEMCANEIIDTFSNPILPKDGIEALFVVPTIGVAMYPEDGRDADTLLKNADLAGYEAKVSDSVIVFCSEQLKSRIEESALLTNRLFHSLQNEEFSLEFQPQISCSTEKIVGVEALLRWNYSDKRRISPDVFIPMLEKTGLIHDVGLWVLEQALQEHNRLIAKGFPPLRFSINLSIEQFRSADFVPDVLKRIEESRVDPKYIELEITESLLSRNFADTIGKLDKLKEAGLSIAIDDFGKGYSSLHRLELVPFDRLKIDKSIIDDITLKRKKIVIAKTIVSMGKDLMASITAEGVETKEQLDSLKNMDCDEIQGYYYSRPLPADALEEYLKKEHKK